VVGSPSHADLRRAPLPVSCAARDRGPAPADAARTFPSMTRSGGALRSYGATCSADDNAPPPLSLAPRGRTTLGRRVPGQGAAPALAHHPVRAVRTDRRASDARSPPSAMSWGCPVSACVRSRRSRSCGCGGESSNWRPGLRKRDARLARSRRPPRDRR
jgi:hypothetical protein